MHVISKRVNLQCEEKFGRQPIKLSRKKTTTEEDIQLNEELIKIYLEAVEKICRSYTGREVSFINA